MKVKLNLCNERLQGGRYSSISSIKTIHKSWIVNQRRRKGRMKKNADGVQRDLGTLFNVTVGTVLCSGY